MPGGQKRPDMNEKFSIPRIAGTNDGEQEISMNSQDDDEQA